MHTEIYCQRLSGLDSVKAIRAIHQAYLQLMATGQLAMSEGFDNDPAIKALAECLADAGHHGFKES